MVRMSLQDLLGEVELPLTKKHPRKYRGAFFLVIQS